MADILSIGQSALTAAQVGINTTGHNIANANTTGYSRQTVIQGTTTPQATGFGYVGSGTQVTAVQRVYSQFLTANVNSAQSTSGASSAYYAEIQQIDNLFSDPTSGLSSSIQKFFSGVQNLSSDASSVPARQSMLSSAQSLATEFQGVSSQLDQITGDMNTQITSSINSINTYATQIAQLNDSIEKAQAGGQMDTANDLLDQRDQAIANLSKEVKVSTIQQGNSVTVSIGSGQPLVVGSQAYQLTTTTSPSDPSRVEVGYANNGNTMMLPENSITGGTLGGLFDFRANTLDPAVNSVGQLAISIGMTVNAQNKLGQDANGDVGGALFNVGSPVVIPNANNSANSTGQVNATITDASALTTSNYQVKYDGTNVTVTRLSDGTTTSATLASLANSPLVVDGIQFNMTGTPVTGDEYLVKPTAAGAYSLSVAITDPSKIAAAAPVLTSASSSNIGTGTISAGVVNSTTIVPTAVSLTYTAGPPSTLSGFPSGMPITVTTPPVAPATTPTTTTYPAGSTVPYTGTQTISFGGVEVSGLSPLPASGTSNFSIGVPNSTLTYDGTNLSGFPNYLDVTVSVPATPPATTPTVTTYPAGTAVPYTAGSTISVGGVSFSISGTPAKGDQFTIGPNSNGVGDNRNILLMANLQQTKTMDNGTNSYGSALTQFVNAVGNKANELEATSTADTATLSSAVTAQQSESGVNLDEEATNLLRYQQAYQAAGKIMQIASQLFNTLLQIGG
jgi:flagellar hook-associated protein 1 FlgK